MVRFLLVSTKGGPLQLHGLQVLQAVGHASHARGPESAEDGEGLKGRCREMGGGQNETTRKLDRRCWPMLRYTRIPLWGYHIFDPQPDNASWDETLYGVMGNPEDPSYPYSRQPPIFTGLVKGAWLPTIQLNGIGKTTRVLLHPL